ncbi:MAG: tRNA pseudouridine(38-40) synthase TruA [Clostridia bacterium]
MNNLKLIVEYDGTDFFGWQTQEGKRTVEEIVEKTLSDVLKEHIKLEASGRTDKGVHAKAQVCSFTCERNFDFERLPYATNYLLPSDISLISCAQMPDDFHARFSSKRKTYEYTFFCGQIRSPLKERYALRVPFEVDENLMKKASKLFEGTHDFSSFVVSKSKKENCERTIYSCNLTKENDLYKLNICGNGFLHNMVRIIAGTILDVGVGKIKPEQILEILESKNRSYAGKTLPPNGLCLLSVDYEVRG